MTIKPIKWIILLTFVLALLGAACGGRSESESGSGGTEIPAGEPSEPVEGDVITGEANIESIDIFMMESFPVQVSVLARGNHPDGCTEVSEVEQVSLDEYTIKLSIYTQRLVGAMCTDALVPFEETFPLDVNGLPAGTYTVDVNGVSGTFELTVDNVPVEEPAVTCPTGTEDLTLFENARDGYCLLRPVWYRASSPQPGVAYLSGPRSGQGEELIEVFLTIENLGAAGGRSAEDIANEILADAEAAELDIDWGKVSLGGEEAITADNVPGIFTVRQTFVVHDDTAYTLTLSPVDQSLPTATRESELLWSAILPSFTFIEKKDTASSGVDEACNPNSEFVGDVTVPDGTQVTIGTAFIKTWRMRNSGTCPWDGTYEIAQVDAGGNYLLALPQAMPLPETQPGEEVDVSVTIQLSADALSNSEQKAQFQMRTSNNEYFGAAPFVKIIAVSGSSPGGSTPSGTSISGVVWNDICSVVDIVPSDGCVTDEWGSYRANGIIDDGEVGISGVTVLLNPGECTGFEGAVTTTTGSDGRYAFTDLSAAPYCVLIDPLVEPNFSILLPGGFTSPLAYVGGITLYVAEGENSVVNFGWDYDFD